MTAPTEERGSWELEVECDTENRTHPISNDPAEMRRAICSIVNAAEDLLRAERRNL